MVPLLSVFFNHYLINQKSLLIFFYVPLPTIKVQIKWWSFMSPILSKSIQKWGKKNKCLKEKDLTKINVSHQDQMTNQG